MSIVPVALDARSYNITIEAGTLERVGELTRAALDAKTRKLALISNQRVYDLFGKIVTKSLKKAGFTTLLHLIGDGERTKSLKTAERVWSFLLDRTFRARRCDHRVGRRRRRRFGRICRRLFQRGMPFVQIPTTLLAQIDSSVGGKTAVNHPLGKNLIGAFHQPRAVIIDPLVLQTLPRRELRAGLYEALKYGVIRDRALFTYLCDHQKQIEAFDALALGHIIQRSCEIKAEVVVSDERESGLRRILNYGHTIGHALEAVTAYRRLKHGEAVGYGMRAAASIAAQAGLLSKPEQQAIVEGIAGFGRLPRIADLSVPAVIAAMAHDKKAAQGKVPLILPTSIGEVIIRDDIPAATIRASIKELLT